MSERIIPAIARELDARPTQVEAAVKLLDDGATVPFIARYRKEITGGLDDTRLRSLETRLNYLRELEDRRATVLEQIDEQGKLTPELKREILAADTKTRLEDLYLPYKKKRRTKGEIAREAGLEPLATTLLEDPARDPTTEAAKYQNTEKGIDSPDKALEGARAILAETFAEDPQLAGSLREYLWDKADVVSRVVQGKTEEGRKFSDYFEHRETLARVPSHRALALFRGRKEGVLRLDLELPGEEGSDGLGTPERRIAARVGIEDRGRPADHWLLDTVRHTWRVKMLTRLRTDVMLRLRERAEAEAIDVFANNLHDLLLAAPAGPRSVLGIDPGLRTGSKVAVVDATGKLVETTTIYPHPPQKQRDRSLAELTRLVHVHGVELVAIGNGTASRETERLAAELVQKIERPLEKLVVSEAGASVYSASETAAREFPDLDVSLRGAVSIARRLQDPLAELVKIEPKSIGVGQYQHDVSQSRLARSLDAVVEDCVNAVGVDANTASAPLLARVSGLGAGLAENLVSFREQKGAFSSRKSLLKVPRFGDKAFEQAAGFLRIRGGNQPLDASAVHPEAYPVVERIIDETGLPIERLIGHSEKLRSLSPEQFTDHRFGVPTVRDILGELEKPGRDPRPEFRTAEFREGVESLEDLREGMTLEGVVTNVTNFGAFVDVGVHQDGLVHISRMAEKFVRDPRDVARPGQVVKVKVLEIDRPRRRIGLTMRLDDEPGAESDKPRREKKGQPNNPPKKKSPARNKRNQQPEGVLAAALKEKFNK